MRKFADPELLDFENVAALAEGKLGTVAEIENSWTFKQIMTGLAYLQMQADMREEIEKELWPKVK